MGMKMKSCLCAQQHAATLLFFTDKGKVYSSAFQLPKKAGRQRHRPVNIRGTDETVTALLSGRIPGRQVAAHRQPAARLGRIALSEFASVRPRAYRD